ncbi:MAG: tRNA preQ1(34) S-adenosylmethionine ribosyltransferase-isomerase QueA [Pseudomonadota bacterium]
MRTADFDYDLPQELIAQSPVEPRDQARLLLAAEPCAHRRVSDLPDLLEPGDLLVVNDSKVVKARLRAAKDSGGRAELLLERALDVDVGLFQVRVSKPLLPGRKLALAGGQVVEVLGRGAGRDAEFYRLRFSQPILDVLEAVGEVPLPPYIDPAAARADHDSRYQTLFAAQPGAVAAPTAGLHFTPRLVSALEARGVAIARVTLHVGAGTFQPVRGEDLSAHRMHSERWEIPAAAAEAIEARRGRLVAVGTTVVRTLEAAAAGGWAPRDGACAGDTDLFITPGYRFRLVDALLTNFHLPRSTLLMLVSAFAGQRRIQDAYAVAVAERYRFFSYGDAMFLTRDEA